MYSQPQQIVIHFDLCTLLLFHSGNCRIMGKASSLDDVSCILNFLVDLLHTSIISPLTLVSQTVVFKLNVVNVNLHKLVRIIPNSIFEPELFPSLSIDAFKPLHVNLFSSGKVVILGKDALSRKLQVETWLTDFVLKQDCDIM